MDPTVTPVFRVVTNGVDGVARLLLRNLIDRLHHDVMLVRTEITFACTQTSSICCTCATGFANMYRLYTLTIILRRALGYYSIELKVFPYPSGKTNLLHRIKKFG